MPTNPAISSPPKAPMGPGSFEKAVFWDRIARKYAASAIADEAGYERSLKRVLALLSPSQQVLEIGCGTGSTALRLAPGVGQMLSTDVSDEMIAIAREKLAARPLANLRFAVADADAPCHAEEAFDAVLAFNLLHLVDDLAGALSSMSSALKPGGLFISKTPCLGLMNPLLHWIALPVMKALGKAPPVQVFDASELESAIRQAGFEVLSVEWHASKGKDVRPFIVARKPLKTSAPGVP
ncbi:methyltransferase domain-containing protein [Hydrogenophaga sp. 5NK40-0174]|uniref:class I SAM-dependent methyltransferase n=1 Tax=Hydrogenophaga sp. 5NK40-0174 TaxID=3127649 RepID=UPI0033415B91